MAEFSGFYASLRSPVTEPANGMMLDDSQLAWVDYRKKACGAMDAFWQGGTIHASQVLSCEILITRSRMRELNELYNMLLHH